MLTSEDVTAPISAVVVNSWGSTSEAQMADITPDACVVPGGSTAPALEVKSFVCALRVGYSPWRVSP